MSKALVGNAADSEQVHEAAEKIKLSKLNDAECLKAILETKQGRTVIWKWLKHCKVFESIYDSSARIHYNAGKQDVGHFLLAEVLQANKNAYLQMMQEAEEGEI